MTSFHPGNRTVVCIVNVKTGGTTKERGGVRAS